MHALRWFLGALWRVWFLLINAVFLLAMLPLLILSVAHPKVELLFFTIARLWAWWNLLLMGFVPVVQRFYRPQRGQQYIVVANHSSYLDIMMVIALCPFPVLFIGKEELGRIPLFGFFYRKVYLTVNRKSLASKRAVMDRAAMKLRDGYSLCIFPEGGIPDEQVRLAPFRTGAFKLAIDTGTPLLPLAFPNNKYAFPDALHRGKPGRLRAVMEDPLGVEGLLPGDVERLKADAYAVIDRALSLHGY
jgi:1-acyl-sn-glycerol-3-phosphate acyltransferase